MSEYTPHPGGRPKIEWDEKDIAQFKSMCSMMCTEKEVCSVMGVTEKTLVRLINEYLYEEITGYEKSEELEPISFKDAFEQYSAQGRASIRRMQYKAAQAGDKTMLVWLGKQWLGQTDKVEQNIAQVPYIVDDIA